MKLNCSCGGSAEFLDNIAGSIHADKWQERHADCGKLRAELANSRAVVKDICAEWHEDCDPCCDSFGHVENCRAVSIAAAKRALNEEVVRLQAEQQTLRNAAVNAAEDAERARNGLREQIRLNEQLRVQRDLLATILDGLIATPCPTPSQWRAIVEKAKEVRAALEEKSNGS